MTTMNEGLQETEKFMHLCLHQTQDELQFWLNQRPNFDIGLTDLNHGNTGLHWAALSEEESREKAEFLLHLGANPSVRLRDFEENVP